MIRYHRRLRDDIAIIAMTRQRPRRATNRRADPHVRLPISDPDSLEHVHEQNILRSRA